MTNEFKDARLEELILLARLERKNLEPFHYDPTTMHPAHKQMVLTMIEQGLLNDESTFSWPYRSDFNRNLQTARTLEENDLQIRRRYQFWELLNQVYGDQRVDLRIGHKGRVRLSELRQALKTGRDRDSFGILWEKRHAEQDLSIALTSVSTAMPLSLVFLDMNGLKAANARYGHYGADDLIKHFLRLIQAALVPPAEAYRYGGDEALVIMPGTAADSARQWSLAFLKRLAEEQVNLNGQQATVKACIGVVTTSDPSTVGKELIARADKEMYRAKGDSLPETRPSALAAEGRDVEYPEIADRKS